MENCALEARYFMLSRISVLSLCALTLAVTLASAQGSSSPASPRTSAKAASATSSSATTTVAKTTTSAAATGKMATGSSTASTTTAKTTTSAAATGRMKSSMKVDLNSASREDLVKLPMIGEAKADQIIAGRPWKTKRELVKKGILTQKEYMKVSGMIVAHQAGAKMEMKMEGTEKK